MIWKVLEILRTDQETLKNSDGVQGSRWLEKYNSHPQYRIN